LKTIQDFKAIANRYRLALNLFRKLGGTQLAAAASFYAILTFVPFVLLLIRLIGWIFGDMEKIHNMMFSIGRDLFPNAAPGFLENVQLLLKGPLFGGASFTIINFCILLISSLSFFNAVWSGLYVISRDKTYRSIKKHFKGLLLIILTVMFLIVAFSVHPVLIFIVKALQHNSVMDFVYDNSESLRGAIVFFKSLRPEKTFLFRADLLHFIVFFLYFTTLYRWFFHWRLAKKSAFLASATFVGLMLLGKNLFWIYFFYVRETLKANYGDFYTTIVAIIWVYLMMCFFYYGVCLCVVLKQSPIWKKKIEQNVASETENGG